MPKEYHKITMSFKKGQVSAIQDKLGFELTGCNSRDFIMRQAGLENELSTPGSFMRNNPEGCKQIAILGGKARVAQRRKKGKK